MNGVENRKVAVVEALRMCSVVMGSAKRLDGVCFEFGVETARCGEARDLFLWLNLKFLGEQENEGIHAPPFPDPPILGEIFKYPRSGKIKVMEGQKNVSVKLVLALPEGCAFIEAWATYECVRGMGEAHGVEGMETVQEDSNALILSVEEMEK